MRESLILNRSILDSDIYSEVVKGIDTQVRTKSEYYLAEFGSITISSITVFEVVWGLQRKSRFESIELQKRRLNEHFVLDVDADVALLGGQIYGDLFRSGQVIGITDSMIAATALHHNLTLVTGNLKHYERIQTLGYPLRLENWRVD